MPFHFDWHVDQSLKTEDHHQHGKHPVAYHISHSTKIGKITKKQPLSSTVTKTDSLLNLSQKVVEKNKYDEWIVVVAFREEVISNHSDFIYLRSNQEEADTKIMLYARDAARRDVDITEIRSPDTKVLVIVLRWYPISSNMTFFVTVKSDNKRKIPLEPIHSALGPIASVLPVFHAFTGADQTGQFYGKGKRSCWKALLACVDDVVTAFTVLRTPDAMSDDNLAAFEHFVCQLQQHRSEDHKRTKVANDNKENTSIWMPSTDKYSTFPTYSKG